MKHHPFGASSLNRLFLCPLSFKMSLGIEDKRNSDSDLGTLLHKAIEEENIELAPLEHQGCVEFAIEYLHALIEKHNPKEIIKEKRISIHNKKNEEISFGTADVVLVCEDYVIVLDWKTLFGDHVEAKDNLQIAHYSLGLSQEYNVEKVLGILALPQLNNCSEYMFTKFDKILALIESIIANCQKHIDELKPNPSLDACKFCKGNVKCLGTKEATYDVEEKRHTFDLATIDNGKLIEVFEMCKLVEKYKKEVQAELEQRIEDSTDQQIDGYGLKYCKGRKKFSDASQVFGKVKSFINKDALYKLISIPVGKLQTTFVKEYRAQTGCNKQEAECMFYEQLGDNIEVGNPYTKLEKQR